MFEACAYPQSLQKDTVSVSAPPVNEAAGDNSLG